MNTVSNAPRPAASAAGQKETPLTISAKHTATLRSFAALLEVTPQALLDHQVTHALQTLADPHTEVLDLLASTWPDRSAASAARVRAAYKAWEIKTAGRNLRRD